VQATQSVTVLIPPSEQAGVMSDVASKPIFIATDLAERIQAAQAMQIDNYLIVEASGRVLISRAMSERVRWLQQPKQIQIIP
jgi:thiamine biosynthesis lipoprotein